MNVNAEIARELLDYNPETGEFTWKYRERHWFSSLRGYKTWNAKHAGKCAGYLRTDVRWGYQYREVRLMWANYKEHRLAWLWMTGEWPVDEIDHKNQDATDNRWTNLRQSTHQGNMRNLSLSKNNTSGYIGVSWEKRYSKWLAYARLDGKRKYLGMYDELERAAAAVRVFYTENGYDKAHGLKPAHYHA